LALAHKVKMNNNSMLLWNEKKIATISNICCYSPTIHQKSTSMSDCSRTTWFNGVVAFWMKEQN